MIRKLAIGLAASMALTVSAEAAMVQALEGPVFVDNGQGYQAISGAMQIAPGNLVLAGNGGKAQILYENGCSVAVDSGQTVAVTDTPPECKRRGGWLIGAAAIGGIAAGVILLADDDDGDAKPVSP